MNKILKKLDQFSGVKGPVMVVVMDGVGLAARHDFQRGEVRLHAEPRYADGKISDGSPEGARHGGRTPLRR